MSIRTRRYLLTGSWATDVDVLEAAILRFTSERPMTNDCEVALFEVVRDGELHVNVMHKYETTTIRGWAGPAVLHQGFVHNRTFRDTQPQRIIGRIREMVYAPLA